MKRLLPIHPFAARIACGIVLAITALNASATPDTAPDAAPAQIARLLSTTYDRPGRHVVTEAVAVAGAYAIADWTQRDISGRALLRREQGRWTIVTCGGDALKDPALLKDAGVPASDASLLLTRLAAAERPMSAAQVKRFDRFHMPSDAPPSAAAH